VFKAGRAHLEEHGTTDKVPVELGGPFIDVRTFRVTKVILYFFTLSIASDVLQDKKLTFNSSMGQTLFLAKFFVRDCVIRILGDVRYCKVANTTNIAKLFKCPKDSPLVSEARGKALALFEEIKKGEHDEDLMAWVGLWDIPAKSLTQATAVNYYQALLEPIMSMTEPCVCMSVRSLNLFV
jgi:hypothetical protein